MVRNPPLREALADLGRSAVAVLQDAAAAVRQNIGGGFQGMIAIAHLIEERKGDLAELKGWKASERILTNDPALALHFGQLVGTPDTKVRLDLPQMLTRFVHDVLFHGDGCRFDEVAFDDIYRRLEGFLYESTIPILVTIPLAGVDLHCDKIDCGGDVKLHKVTSCDDEAFLRALCNDDEIGASVAHLRRSVTAQISFVLHTPKVVGETKDPKMEGPRKISPGMANNVIYAMRVLKPGRFAVLWTKFSPQIWGPTLGEHRTGPSSLDTTIWGGNYALGPEDEPELQRLRASIDVTTHRGSGALNVSLRWFWKALEEHDVEDRLIALMIAAEAFFLKDGGQGELKYRWAQRVAVYLKEKLDARIELTQFAREAYNLRSMLVHGKQLPERIAKANFSFEGKAIESLPELVGFLETVMRRSLKKALMTSPDQRPCENPRLWDSLVLS